MNTGPHLEIDLADPDAYRRAIEWIEHEIMKAQREHRPNPFLAQGRLHYPLPELAPMPVYAQI